MINQLRLKNTFLQLVSINGKSGNEKEVADYIQKKLTEIGIKSERDNAGSTFNGNCGNVIATLVQSTDWEMPSILFSSHMDTIEPTVGIKPIEMDGIIKTDKSTILGADNRAGVAVVLEILRTIKENNLSHPTIHIVFSVAEEVGMFGSKFINKEKVNAVCGFVFDSSARPGKVIINAPSTRYISIKVFGKAAHAAVQPENGVNALKIAGNAIAKINTGKFKDFSTFNFGKIKGGKAINIVPDFVEIEAECRGFDYDSLDNKLKDVQSIFEKEANLLGGKIKFSSKEKYGLFKLKEDELPVQIAFDAIKNSKLFPEGITYSGGSDANVYNSKGIPTVNLGMGFQNVHSINEYIGIDDLIKDAEIGLNIVKEAYKKLNVYTNEVTLKQ